MRTPPQSEPKTLLMLLAARVANPQPWRQVQRSL